MALKKEVYKVLEDVVGQENISEDPVVIESYPFPIRKATMANENQYLPRFEAITLPGSTREVQQLVKLCNKHKIQYKASSTGWLYCDPTGPGCIKMDLRRMNRILEINEKSMYAVVEPYVIYAQLQGELMKRGFNCNVTGAGSNCSALPMAAHVNLGHVSQSQSYGERNQLGLEWVTGDGEIVRMGSVGSLGEWFSGDGPGPSLRGIIRGNTVPLGGLGVFTAAAQKIYHWAGPPTFPMEGISPRYAPSYIPDRFMCRYLSFANMTKFMEAVQKIGESEIAFEVMGFNTAMIASNAATDNEEDLKLYHELNTQVQGPGFIVGIMGNSDRDFEFKKKVLAQIMEETEAWSLKMIEDPETGRGFVWRYIRTVASIRETQRATGLCGGTVGGTDLFPLMTKYILHSEYLKKQLVKEGMLLDDATYPFVQSIENGHTGHGEILIRYTPMSPDHIEKTQGLFDREANKLAIEGHFGVPQHVWSDKLHDMYGPHTNNYHLWLRKIKKTFDPNHASESSNYISVKE